MKSLNWTLISGKIDQICIYGPLQSNLREGLKGLICVNFIHFNINTILKNTIYIVTLCNNYLKFKFKHEFIYHKLYCILIIIMKMKTWTKF